MKKIILILLFLFAHAYSMEKKPNVTGFVKILDEVIASRGSNLVYSMVILEFCDLYVNPEKTIKNPDAKKYLDDLSLLDGDKISEVARKRIQYDSTIKPGYMNAWKLDFKGIHLSDLLEQETKK
ncbi:hypothetical protein HYX58_05590 [Candidatus Dependentiae bacterium]|nr:hypothetical protein [Candidatus Dependentiae bacterium]